MKLTDTKLNLITYLHNINLYKIAHIFINNFFILYQQNHLFLHSTDT